MMQWSTLFNRFSTIINNPCSTRYLSKSMYLNEESKLVIAGLKGNKKPSKKIRGRGPGSGCGRQSGRGHKGQGQRGTLPRSGFEGGQFPFYLSVSKFGFINHDKPTYAIVQLAKLQYFIENNRLDPNSLITSEVLMKCGLVNRFKDGVKILSRGAENFTFKIDVAVSKVTPKAAEIIEKNKGTVTTVYHSKQYLDALEFCIKHPHDPRALVLRKSRLDLNKNIQLPGTIDPSNHEQLVRKTGEYEIVSEVSDEPITYDKDNSKSLPNILFERPPLHLLGYYSNFRKRGFLSGYGGKSILEKDLDSY